jgi:TonB-dependent receptor
MIMNSNCDRKYKAGSIWSILARTASIVAIAYASPGVAQVAGTVPSNGVAAPSEDASQEIVITGLRGSLQRNLDIKRAAAGVVDAISSEDIGKFPDSNVAASLQRVPGVSIQRSGQRGEPTGITVRGFGGDFNETLFDGRRLSTATGGRSIDFSTVGADFVGQMQVLKTPDVSLSSASIGATVNILFPKPFDHPGLRVAASASGSMQQHDGQIRPTAGVLFSDTFADDRFGILIDATYTRHDNKTNHVFVSGWEGVKLDPCQLTPSCVGNPAVSTNRTVVSWFQQQFGAEQAQTRDERLDGRIALQLKFSDKMLLTLDDNYSRQAVQNNTYGFGVWFGWDEFRSVKLDGNGTIVDFVDAPGAPMNINAGIDHSILQTNQTGLNLKWQATDRLSFDLDGNYAKSWLNPNGEISTNGADTGYGRPLLGQNLGVKVVGDSRNTLPQLTTYGPNGDKSRYLDPTIIGSHVLVRMAQKNVDTVKQARLIAAWDQGSVKIKLGGSYLDDTYHMQNRNTFANNFWQTWAGYGAPSGISTGVVLPATLQQGTISTANFIPGFAGNGALPPSLRVYSPIAVYNYLQGLGNPQAKNIPGYNYSCCGTAYTGTLDLALDPGSVRDIRERTWSAFFKLNFETQLGDMPFHFDAGLREESTRITSAGIGRLPTALTNSPADQTLLVTTFSASQPVSTKSSYAYFLPSLDAKLELTDKLNLRFDASRTLTRPPLGSLTPVLNVGSLPRVGALLADGGNPRLKPYVADNFDVAGEWYYQSNSYISVDFFLKDVTNFVVAGTQRQTINNVIDPTTGQPAIYTVSQQINGPKATVKGVELAWQHVFGSSGFGFNANATFVGTNRPYDPKDISLSGFAITGLANSANFVGFYDKHGLEARVALNWRDEYLLQFGQGQNNSAFGAEPTFVNSSLQIDFSASYQITKNISVFAEALNLTNETQSTHGRFDNQLLDVFAYGRRFTAGARFRF